MATRPTLHTAVSGQKNKASDYNENFDLMMSFIDDSIAESKNYVDGFMPSVSGKADKFLTNDGTETVWANIPLYAGSIIYYGGSYAPTGWLICDGSAISRTTYADLFSAIGTIYGAGDESTTFNLPDYINNPYIKGSSTVGTLVDAKVPNIRGSFGVTAGTSNATTTGAFYVSAVSGRRHTEDASGGTTYSIDASRSSTVYKNDATTVEPKSLTALPIIKY